MATANSLQIPKILGIQGSTIKIAHPDVSDTTSTSLASQIAASGTAMSVLDNNGFADNDWFIVGKPGFNQTEECDVNGAVTRGQSMTVTNTLKFAHPIDSPVTKINERAIKIYGAATDGGAGTLITSVDAITTPVADGVQIQWDKPCTEYTLISTDDAFAYYYVVFTDGTTDSSASAYVPAAGITSSTVERFINKALDLTGQKINERVGRETMVRWANDCQDAIMQFKWQDPRTGQFQQKDWSFEIILDETSLAVSEGENTYALSSLTYALKYPNSDRAIIDVRIGPNKPLRKMAVQDYDRYMAGVARTTVNSAITAGDTSITVVSTADFADSGSITIGDDVGVTYTAKTATTFTGIPASGTGALGSAHDVDDSVWQNITSGLPTRYMVQNNQLILDRPVDEDHDSQAIRIRYKKMMTELTSESDVITIPFKNVFPTYLVGMIHYRNGKDDLGDRWMQKFKDQVLDNALADFIPVEDEWQYENYVDEVYSGTCANSTSDNNDYYDFV